VPAGVSGPRDKREGVDYVKHLFVYASSNIARPSPNGLRVASILAGKVRVGEIWLGSEGSEGVTCGHGYAKR